MTGILCIQFKPVCDDKEFNIKTIERLIKENCDKDIDLVVMPEFFSTGIDHTAFINEPEDINGGNTISKIQDIAIKYNTNIIAGTVIETENKKLYNTSFIINRHGKILAKYRKIHLFNYLGGTEGERITPGDEVITVNFDFGKVGIAICYDIRYPLHYKKLAQQGAEIIVLPTAWVVSDEVYKSSLKQEQELWIALNRIRAYDNMVYTIACNQTGLLNDRIGAIGTSIICSPLGDIISKADNEPCVLYAQLNLNSVRSLKTIYPIASID